MFKPLSDLNQDSVHTNKKYPQKGLLQTIGVATNVSAPRNLQYFANFKLLKLMLILTAIIMCVYGVINFIIGRYFLAFSEMVVFLSTVFTLKKFNRIINSRLSHVFTTAYTISILTLLMSIFAQDDVFVLVFVWIFLIPMMAYTLTGLQSGFRITATFTLISIGLYLFNHPLNISEFQVLPWSNVILCMLGIWIVTHTYEKSNQKSKAALMTMTKLDPLTKLYNRSHLYEVYSKYSNKVVCLVLLDIDGLKNINAQYGHLAGDVVLLNIAKIFNESNEFEYVFRVGDGEFAIFIPNANCDDCLVQMRELFAKITDCKTVLKKDIIPISISMALACIKSDGNNLDTLMQDSVKQLLKAKQSKTDKIAL